MEMMRESVYSSSLSGKDGLLAETWQVLDQIAAGYVLQDVRTMVVEQNLLSKQSPHTRQAVWDAIRRRLAGMGSADRLAWLARTVTSPALTQQARNLILFYELCRSHPLLTDLTTDCLYPLYLSGRSVVDKDDVLAWLERMAGSHPEIMTWSPQTRVKLASNYLSIVRDFGLLSGMQQKRFVQVYIPLPTFLYLVYDLYDQGLAARAIVASPTFRLMLIDDEDLTVLLHDATRARYITFRQSGDIIDLVFHYPSLVEVMHHVSREVS